jgi:hypothetical protein
MVDLQNNEPPDLETRAKEKHSNKWIKYMAGAAAALTIGYFANHYTGDKTGIEGLIKGNGRAGQSEVVSMQKTSEKNPYTEETLREYLRSKNLDLAYLDWGGLIMPVGIQQTKPKIRDENYSAALKIYIATTDDSNNIKLIEANDAFMKMIDEGQIMIITGYLPSSKSGSQSDASRTAQSLTRIIR